MSSMESGGSFESLHQDLVLQGMTPIDLPVPEDPYSWRRQQFNALKSLGYPVELQKVSGAYAREAYAAYTDPETGQEGIPELWHPWYEHRFNVYRDWRLPVVHYAGFANWVQAGIGVQTEDLKLSEDQRTDLFWHPATILPGAVDLGLFKTVKEYKDDTDKHPPYMSDGEQWRTHRHFVANSYISAFDRFVQMAKLIPPLLEDGDRQPTRTELSLYRSFGGSGLQGVNAYELVALIRDFYTMLGAAVPKFAKFSSGD